MEYNKKVNFLRNKMRSKLGYFIPETFVGSDFLSFMKWGTDKKIISEVHVSLSFPCFSASHFLTF